MAQIPTCPRTFNEKEVLKTLNDLIGFISERNSKGIRFNSYTQDEIDNFTDLSDAGTMVFNSTTKNPNLSYIDNNELKWGEPQW